MRKRKEYSSEEGGSEKMVGKWFENPPQWREPVYHWESQPSGEEDSECDWDSDGREQCNENGSCEGQSCPTYLMSETE